MDEIVSQRFSGTNRALVCYHHFFGDGFPTARVIIECEEGEPIPVGRNPGGTAPGHSKLGMTSSRLLTELIGATAIEHDESAVRCGAPNATLPRLDRELFTLK